MTLDRSELEYLGTYRQQGSSRRGREDEPMHPDHEALTEVAELIGRSLELVKIVQDTALAKREALTRDKTKENLRPRMKNLSDLFMLVSIYDDLVDALNGVLPLVGQPGDIRGVGARWHWHENYTSGGQPLPPKMRR